MTSLKDRVFTKKQLIKVEEMVSKHAFKDIAISLNMDLSVFNGLRDRNESIKDAVDKGKKKRVGKLKEIDQTKGYLGIAQSSEQMQQSQAWQKFREEFKANKERMVMKELREIDLI